MLRDVREYFRSCHVPGERRAAQTGLQLARGGISDMDVLCKLLENEPEKLLSIRNIGLKSLKIIHEVCTSYRRERGDIP